MRTTRISKKSSQGGGALLLTLVMMAVALVTLAGILSWSAQSTRLTYRSNQYTRSVAAAEALTEKVVSQIGSDYLNGGERMVNDNLESYRQMSLKGSDDPSWSQWAFTDPSGHPNRTYVQPGDGTSYIVLDSTYAGLHGYATTCTVVSNAREKNSVQNVVGAVLQEIQLARIPIFQFVMYSSGDMEISCGQPFNVTGRVHCNKTLYVEPDNALEFQSSVAAVADILFQRHPLDSRTPPIGTVVYDVPKNPHESALSLPIGTTNTPTAIREIIQPPASHEDPNSPIARLRYYNQSDLVITVSDTGVVATSGRFNGFATSVPTNQVAQFVSTTNSFFDARESKTVRAIDLNIGVLTSWSATNATLRPALGANDVSSVYIWDRRTITATTLGGVRVRNGQWLPPRGLTVATADPLYVLGHYNQTNSAFLGTTNTTTTRPASLVGDAITILSTAWSDSASANAVGTRVAAPTTVNAAILAGAVDTVQDHYSGGMENFVRFLETWGLANPLSYNGSMVKMFPSKYATNFWGTANVYSPPKRDWSYDLNFNDPEKLPPLTPGLQKVIRSQWTTVAPNQTMAAIAP